MGRIPCCERDNVKRGQWTPEEDNKLAAYIAQHGTRNWRLIPKNAGLQRCGKSCRLRWTNYLRPDLKHGEFSEEEEQTIVKLHSVLGNSSQLPGRTDNDVKNHWNTKLKKKLSGMGIDPVTHKTFSHLIAEITSTLAPPQMTHLAEAALGCFKDEVLHLLTRKRADPGGAAGEALAGLYPAAASRPADGFGYGASSFCDDAERLAWSQSVCTSATCEGGGGGGPAGREAEALHALKERTRPARR
ncbi:unnamed protein product [Spirodela intermedia]|uniref:Uncharacterized protein n=1 Tax=Spirodela intermedia TaxID=51605 RepID=A0A7I8IRA5_SPIIN|nr:unnamed protein product [Spirodela intermedia]CAA6660302.1 unnamed protein product [Spirodela intermedia]